MGERLRYCAGNGYEECDVNMIKVCVRENNLEGLALDWAMADATGTVIKVVDGNKLVSTNISGHYGRDAAYSPQTDWNRVGHFIRLYRLTLSNELAMEPEPGEILYPSIWKAHILSGPAPKPQVGSTPLIAICRAIVTRNSSRDGAFVTVPEFLYTNQKQE